MMTWLDTSGSNKTTTQPEAFNEKKVELKRDSICESFEMSTGALHTQRTVPSGLPVVGGEGGGNYVFRVTLGSRMPQLVITLDTRHLTEQARVRKLNRSIHHARRQ